MSRPMRMQMDILMKEIGIIFNKGDLILSPQYSSKTSQELASQLKTLRRSRYLFYRERAAQVSCSVLCSLTVVLGTLYVRCKKK